MSAVAGDPDALFGEHLRQHRVKSGGERRCAEALGGKRDEELPDAWRRALLRVPSASRCATSSRPVNPAASISTMSARPVPLCPPSGATVPSSARCGSVVGQAVAIERQALGDRLPLRARARSRSGGRLRWWPCRSPAAAARRAVRRTRAGLVPKKRRLPPHGATSGDEFEQPMLTRPSRDSRSTNQPSALAECERVMPRQATPA